MLFDSINWAGFCDSAMELKLFHHYFCWKSCFLFLKEEIYQLIWSQHFLNHWSSTWLPCFIFSGALLVLPSLSLSPASISAKEGWRTFLSNTNALVDLGSRKMTSSRLKSTNPYFLAVLFPWLSLVTKDFNPLSANPTEYKSSLKELFKPLNSLIASTTKWLNTQTIGWPLLRGLKSSLWEKLYAFFQMSPSHSCAIDRQVFFDGT